MTRFCLCLLSLAFFLLNGQLTLRSQEYADSILPVRGFAIEAPSPEVLDSFIVFINEELAPKKVNTLILRVDFKYQYKTHPELIDGTALSLQQVKRLVNACKRNKIRSEEHTSELQSLA